MLGDLQASAFMAYIVVNFGEVKMRGLTSVNPLWYTNLTNTNSQAVGQLISQSGGHLVSQSFIQSVS